MLDKQINYSTILSVLYGIIAGAISTIYLPNGWIVFTLAILLPIVIVRILDDVEFFRVLSIVLFIIILIVTIFGCFKVKRNVLNCISDFNALIEAVEVDKNEKKYSDIPLLEAQKKSIDNRLKKYTARSLLKPSDYAELEVQYKAGFSVLVAYREKVESFISGFENLIKEMENDGKNDDYSRISSYENRKVIIDAKRPDLNFSDEHNEIYIKLLNRYNRVYNKLTNPNNSGFDINDAWDTVAEKTSEIWDGAKKKGNSVWNWIKKKILPWVIGIIIVLMILYSLIYP